MKLKGKKILLVEDDSFIEDMLVRKLELEGALCVSATNGVEGLEKLRENSSDFDIIITDITMPKIGGYDMAQAIKSDPDSHAIPIIVLTNRTDNIKTNAQLAALGVDAEFGKADTPLHELVQHIVDMFEKTDDAPAETKL